VSLNKKRLYFPRRRVAMADRFEGIKHLVGAAFSSVTTQSPTGTRRASGKDFMRDDLTYGADSAG
jgi:hypothetical protein